MESHIDHISLEISRIVDVIARYMLFLILHFTNLFRFNKSIFDTTRGIPVWGPCNTSILRFQNIVFLLLFIHDIALLHITNIDLRTVKEGNKNTISLWAKRVSVLTGHTTSFTKKPNASAFALATRFFEFMTKKNH